MHARILLFLTGLIFWATTVLAQTDSFMVDGVYRNYNVHLPTGYSTSSAYPLVLNLHGYTSNAAQQEFYTHMDGSADAHYYVVVYPNGIANYWNSWGPPGGVFGANDIKFLSELIDTIAARFSINPKRIYSCGMSNGGYMSYSLACNIADRLAAIASVSGTMSSYTYSNCHVGRKIPVMHIHGTSDATVPYTTGAANSIGVEQTIAFWRDTDNCGLHTDTLDLPNTNTTDGCTVQTIDYRHCDHSEVLFYKIAGGGHTWPGAAIDVPSFGNTDHDIDATDEIWKFFNKYTLDGPMAIAETPDDMPLQISPNPTTGMLYLTSGSTINSTDIFDLAGRKMMSFGQATKMDVSTLATGMYMVCVSENGNKQTLIKMVKE